MREVRCSTFLRDLGLLDKSPLTINIIKANIEGAEWDLISDLDEHDLFGLFDIYLGADQWTADMLKCTDLLDRVGEAKRILVRRGVTVYPWCMGTDNYPMQAGNYDLLAAIRRYVAVGEPDLVHA